MLNIVTLALCLQISAVSAMPGMAGYYKEYKKIKRATAATCPYTGATLNGLPGTQVGGVKVPCDGDTAHQFIAPKSSDIRGPCPGLNTAANHGFISRNGVTNFDELVYAQQNLYNVGYDLAVFLAVVAITFDGDIVSTKLSLGREDTAATATLGGLQDTLLGKEAGLDGHNLFEADTSLTRNDYFLANGDDYTFNGTLFGMMNDTCAGDFNLPNLALYRYQRYQQSLANNANFYFGPKSLLLFGAASFLYELFPSYGDQGNPDLPTMMSFFGAVKSGNTWKHVPERIPANWFNRVAPYTLTDVGNQILEMYLLHPVLFGGNVGKGNFDGLGTAFGAIASGGTLTAPSLSDILCLLYQLATEDVPTSLSGVATQLPKALLNFAVGKLNPIFNGTGCPLILPD